MTFASTADNPNGEQPIILVEVVIGDTTLRWGTENVYSKSAGVQIDGRLVNPGSIDRQLEGSRPQDYDLTVELWNGDGELDDLLVSFTNPDLNIIEGSFTVQRGFASLPINDWRVVAKFQFAELVGADSETRNVTIRLIGQAKKLFGELQMFTHQEVFDELIKVTSPTDFSDLDLEPTVQDEVVRYVFGRWSDRLEKNRLKTKRFALFPTGGGSAFFNSRAFESQGGLYLVGLSPFDWETTNYRYQRLGEDGEAPSEGWTDVRPIEDALVQSVFLSDLGNSGMFALVIHLPFDQTAAIKSTAKATASALESVSRNPRPKELIFTILNEIGDRGDATSANVDTASFTLFDTQTAAYTARGLIEAGGATLDVVASIADSFIATLFINNEGKLAAFNLDPEGGTDPAYTSSIQLNETRDFLAFRWQHGEDGGLHGLVNRVEIDLGPNATFGGTFQEFLANGWNPADQRFSNFLRADFTLANQPSIDDSGRTVSKRLALPWASDALVAFVIATDFLGLRGTPRVIASTTITIRATQLDLGDIVKVNHSFSPSNWEEDRLMIVQAIVDDLATHMQRITLVDYNDILDAKVFILADDTDWEVTSSGTLTVISGSTALVGVGTTFTDADPGDFVEITTSSNMVSIMLDVITDDLNATFKNTAETGTLPTANESGITAWRITRGQGNRETASGSYVVQADKFACLADDEAAGGDGKFLDDTEDGFTLGR